MNRIGEIVFLFKKFDKVFLVFRYIFIGLIEEDELYILELLFLSYVLIFFSFYLSCIILKKIFIIIKCVDIMRNGKFIVCFEFVN